MYSFFILMVWIFLSEGLLINNEFCEYKCKMKHDNETVAINYKKTEKLCSLDNIPNKVTMTVMETAEGVSSDGIVRVNFSPPKEECRHKVALVVNSSIKNSEECEKHIFQTEGINAEEVHTAEKSYCILNNHFNHSQEVKIPFCQDQKLAMWYENIFTGCYALRFRISENEFVFRGQIFIKTDHLHSSINAPEFHCKYTSVPDNNASFETLTFSTSTSNVVQFAGLQQQIGVLSFLDRDKENACTKYNKHTIFSHTIYTDRINATSDNCTLTIAGNSSGQNIECNFEVRSFKNIRFCFVIHFIDDRCKKATRWNPPIKGYLPCTWVQTCMKIETNPFLIVHGGSIQDHGKMDSPQFLCLPFIIIALLIFLTIVGSIYFIHKLRSRNSKCNSSTCSIDLKEEDDSKCLESDEFRYEDDTKKEKGCDKDIILLYTKGSKFFMKMMSDFRNILERCLKCQVHDWFAPEEWDNVATIGGYEWVAKLLKKDCRVVWLDTSKARSLFTLQYNLIDTNVPRNKEVDEFDDFRDCVFPAIVDLAKRQHNVLQYSRHFVVRIEGLEALDETNDPFSDLSPHARYVIPHHLRELCSHLSMTLSLPENQIQLEERRLRQHLVFDEELQSDLSLYNVY